MSVPVLSSAPRSGLPEARASLDEALLALRAVTDPAVDVHASEAALAGAWRHVFTAQGPRTDVGRFQDEVSEGCASAGQASTQTATPRLL